MLVVTYSRLCELYSDTVASSLSSSTKSSSYSSGGGINNTTRTSTRQIWHAHWRVRRRRLRCYVDRPTCHVTKNYDRTYYGTRSTRSTAPVWKYRWCLPVVFVYWYKLEWDTHEWQNVTEVHAFIIIALTLRYLYELLMIMVDCVRSTRQLFQLIYIAWARLFMLDIHTNQQIYVSV